MSWETFVQQAQVDLAAALIGGEAEAIDHITDAEINLERAKEAFETDSEAAEE